MPTKLFFNPNAHMISVVLANNETMFPEKLTFCKIFLYSISSLNKKGPSMKALFIIEWV